MTIQTDLFDAKAKLEVNKAECDALNATIASLEADLAALPVELQGKTDAEIKALGDAVNNYFSNPA
jgi:hypothetical protein